MPTYNNCTLLSANVHGDGLINYSQGSVQNIINNMSCCKQQLHCRLLYKLGNTDKIEIYNTNHIIN